MKDTEQRIEQLRDQLEAMREDIEVCVQRMDARPDYIQKGQCLKTSLRGMVQSLLRIERECIEVTSSSKPCVVPLVMR